MRKFFIILDKLKVRILNFVNYLSSYGKAVANGYKTNALAPLIWFIVFAIPLLTTGIIFINNIVIKYIFTGLICCCIIFPFVMYCILLIKDPKLLQSEAYRIEDKKWDLIAQKGGDITFNPLDIQTKEIRGGNENE